MPGITAVGGIADAAEGGCACGAGCGAAGALFVGVRPVIDFISSMTFCGNMRWGRSQESSKRSSEHLWLVFLDAVYATRNACVAQDLKAED
jgi:hypothetical protein